MVLEFDELEIEHRIRVKPLFQNNILNPDGIALIHAAIDIPRDGKLWPNHYFGKGSPLLRNPRVIVEFSVNGTIEVDRSGERFKDVYLFERHPVFIIIPFDKISDKRFLNVHFTATSHLGPLEIPEGSYLLVKKDKYIEPELISMLQKKGIHLMYFSGPPQEVFKDLLPKLGYEPLSIIHNPKGMTNIFYAREKLQSQGNISWMENEFEYLAQDLEIPSGMAGDSYFFGIAMRYLENIFHEIINGKSVAGMGNYKTTKVIMEKALAHLSEEQSDSYWGRLFQAYVELVLIMTQIKDIFSNADELFKLEVAISMNKVVDQSELLNERRKIVAAIKAISGIEFQINKKLEKKKILKNIWMKLSNELEDKYQLNNIQEQEKVDLQQALLGTAA